MRSAPTAVVLGLVALLLSGCVPAAPRPFPTSAPRTSAAPVFASDEEALAAAVEAYTKYLAVSNVIAAEGGKDPDRLRDVVSPEWLSHETEVYDKFAATGRRVVGETKFSNPILQQYDQGPHGTAEVTLYLCVDFSGTRFIDSSGQDVTAADQPKNSSVQAQFRTSDQTPGKLVVDGSAPWTGTSVC